MKKNEYLAQLNSHLTGIPENEKIEIILDFEEHFSVGLVKGKTEEEICEDLGDPLKNASQYRANGTPFMNGARPPVRNFSQGGGVGAVASMPYYPAAAKAESETNKQTTYLVFFIISIFFAALVYISTIPVFFSGCAVLVSGIATGWAISSWVITALLLSLGVCLMAVSLLIILAATWLCIWLYKKYTGVNKEVAAQ